MKKIFKYFSLWTNYKKTAGQVDQKWSIAVKKRSIYQRVNDRFCLCFTLLCLALTWLSWYMGIATYSCSERSATASTITATLCLLMWLVNGLFLSLTSAPRSRAVETFIMGGTAFFHVAACLSLISPIFDSLQILIFCSPLFPLGAVLTAVLPFSGMDKFISCMIWEFVVGLAAASVVLLAWYCDWHRNKYKSN